jgi:hypothetical protein
MLYTLFMASMELGIKLLKKGRGGASCEQVFENPEGTIWVKACNHEVTIDVGPEKEFRGIEVGEVGFGQLLCCRSESPTMEFIRALRTHLTPEEGACVVKTITRLVVALSNKYDTDVRVCQVCLLQPIKGEEKYCGECTPQKALTEVFEQFRWSPGRSTPIPVLRGVREAAWLKCLAEAEA